MNAAPPKSSTINGKNRKIKFGEIKATAGVGMYNPTSLNGWATLRRTYLRWDREVRAVYSDSICKLAEALHGDPCELTDRTIKDNTDRKRFKNYLFVLQMPIEWCL